MKLALRSGAALLAVVLLSLLAARAVRAADSIYWDSEGTSKISHANLAGGGAGDVPIPGGLVKSPFGLAIDSAAGKIYWANAGDATIAFANLDGSGGGLLNTTGAPVNQPSGLAIDPLAGRLYWANRGNNKIDFANLDGSGAGSLDTTGAPVEGPVGVVVDRPNGRLYWANSNATIAFANLDGNGKGGVLETTGANVVQPEGLAIDAAANRIYWANDGDNTIASASLNGGGGAALATMATPIAEPTGVAIDPTSGRIYWANYFNKTLAFAGLDGSGGALLDTTGAGISFPAFPVILKSPLGVQPPVASILSSQVARTSRRAAGPGANLSCSQGTWAPDLLESFLYRAPHTFSYQWQRNGALITGATSSSFKTSLVGTYTCQAIATNFAGSTSQTSAPIAIAATIKVGKARLNRRRGTAMLPVTVTGSGRLSLTGRGIVAQRRSKAGGTVKLALKAKGRSKRALIAKGKVKLRAVIAFTPLGGKALRVTRPITLKRR